MTPAEMTYKVAETILELEQLRDALSPCQDLEQDLILHAQKLIADAIDLLGSLPAKPV